MDKLIELLNKAKPLKKYKEYWYRGNEIYLITYAEDYGASESRNITLDVISKSFGFIKWLVDNDKINTNHLSLQAFKNIFSGGGFVKVSDLEVLLMLLSIEDNPIEFLCEILK